MKLQEYACCDAIDLVSLVENREVTSAEVVELANLAIDRMNPALNCVVHRIPEAKIADGPFRGLPFLIKEGAAAMTGQPFNMASRMGVGHIADADDEMTRRFRRSGLTIIGQSNAPEAGNAPTTESLLHGPTRNPWNVSYMPGGSSGGAAAAVAAGIIPMAHASDGAGSIRIPAACCGLVGLKPTRGRTPINHSIIFSPTASHVVSRTVRDSAFMLDCIQGPQIGGIFHVQSPLRSYLEEVGSAPEKLKVAFTNISPAGTPVDPECIQFVLEAARICESMGHHVEEVTLNYDWEALLAAFLDIYSYRHPLSIENLERSTGRRCGPDTRETCNLAMLEHAKKLSMLEFARHTDNLAALCQAVGSFFSNYDVLISPVMNQPALPLGQMNANAPDLTASIWFERQLARYVPFTAVYNATGQPAMSLPLGHSRSGLPIGVQFAARHGDEATLLQLAGQMEIALPWHGRKPPTSIF